MKPLLLDTFCKAGGCTKGYQEAGFYVVGIDIEAQPRYIGDDFVQMDALEALRILIDGGYIVGRTGRKYYLSDFTVIHTSPPCQGYSELNRLHKKEYPLLIADVRRLLQAAGRPYVIENVAGARNDLINPIMLCGIHFGLKVYRHRYFEVWPEMLGLPHIPHNDQTPAVGRGLSPKGYISITGTGGFGVENGFDYARKAIGIDWMTRPELSQAIPPAFTRWIGQQLLRVLEMEAA